MAEDARGRVASNHLEASSKHTYFLLAAVGACIAFALTQTKDAALVPSDVPLGVAVACWAGSFFSGCQRLDGLREHLRLNALLLDVLSGTNEEVGRHPQLIAIADSGTRKALDRENNRLAAAGRWQFRLLVLGAAFYIAWHVLQMARRGH